MLGISKTLLSLKYNTPSLSRNQKKKLINVFKLIKFCKFACLQKYLYIFYYKCTLMCVTSIYNPESEIWKTPGKSPPAPAIRAFWGLSKKQMKTVLISISLKEPMSVSQLGASLAITLTPCHQDEIVKMWSSFYVCISSFTRSRICFCRSFTTYYDN